MNYVTEKFLLVLCMVLAKKKLEHGIKIELNVHFNIPFLKRKIQYFCHNFFECANIDFDWCLTTCFMQIVDHRLDCRACLFLQYDWLHGSFLFLQHLTTCYALKLSKQHIFWWLRPPERWLLLFLDNNKNNFSAVDVSAHKISFYVMYTTLTRMLFSA